MIATVCLPLASARCSEKLSIEIHEGRLNLTSEGLSFPTVFKIVATLVGRTITIRSGPSEPYDVDVKNLPLSGALQFFVSSSRYDVLEVEPNIFVIRSRGK